MKKNISLFFVFLYSLIHAQVFTIKGKVTDDKGIPLDGFILLKEDNKIHKYQSFTNGIYEFCFDRNSSAILEFHSVGYTFFCLPVTKLKERDINFRNVILKEKIIRLDEVFIPNKLTNKKDTIKYNASKFIKGKENNIEDLLKNIPNIKVEKNGIIKYNNIEIEKVMVDGDDLFEKGYPLLTRNMPVKSVKNVEILKKFSENRLLKNIEQSNKVALNLKIDENFKHFWFGSLKSNVSIADTIGFRDVQLNLMNFNPKRKYFTLLNHNNTGYRNVDVSYFNFKNKLTSNKKMSDILKPSTLFESERTNFNNYNLFSFNSVFNLSKSSKISLLSYIDNGENNFYKEKVTKIQTPKINFLNFEDLYLKNDKNKIYLKIDHFTNLTKTSTLNSNFLFQKEIYNKKSEINYNNNFIVENLKDVEDFCEINVEYTKKIDFRNALLFSVEYSKNYNDQTYKTNSFSKALGIQKNFISTNLFLTKLKYLKKIRYNQFFKSVIGYKYFKEYLKSDFFFKEKEYSNNLINLDKNIIYFYNSYSFKIDKFSIDPKLDIENLNYYTNNLKNILTVNPYISINYSDTNSNSIGLKYYYKSKFMSIMDVYPNYIYRNFLYFEKGLSDLDITSYSKIELNYQKGEDSDDFTSTNSIYFIKKHSYFSKNIDIRGYTYRVKKYLSDKGYLFSFDSKNQLYLRSIRNNIKLKLHYDQYFLQNIVNDDLKNYKINNYKGIIAFRSAFEGFFNYNIGHEINYSKFIDNSYKTSINFANLYFNFDKVSIDFFTLFYKLESKNTKNYITFLDFDLKYDFSKKLKIGLIGKNLLNQKKYKEVIVMNYFNSVINYRLLPRYVLLKLEYSF